MVAIWSAFVSVLAMANQQMALCVSTLTVIRGARRSPAVYLTLAVVRNSRRSGAWLDVCSGHFRPQLVSPGARSLQSGSTRGGADALPAPPRD